MIRQSKIVSLDQAVSYQNDDVVYKFLDKFSMSEVEARDIFNETKKWLWLSAKMKEKYSLVENKELIPVLFIDDSLRVLDEMWHTFILFTKSYTEYCKNHFNCYLHHQPTTHKEKTDFESVFRKDPTLQFDKFEGRLQDQMSLVMEYLGEMTLIKWYYEYPTKYSYSRLIQIHRF